MAMNEEPANSGIASTHQHDARVTRCLWCNRPYKLGRRRGSIQRFCCHEHRQAFWSAARLYTIRAIEAGQLSIEALKAAL
jgi:hypothetical protein